MVFSYTHRIRRRKAKHVAVVVIAIAIARRRRGPVVHHGSGTNGAAGGNEGTVWAIFSQGNPALHPPGTTDGGILLRLRESNHQLL